MSFGLDYVSGPSPAVLKANNVAFVCRYLSEVNAQTQIKLLTLPEAQALSHDGIAIVSNFEWYASRPSEGFASGAFDAGIARDQHAACGGPPDRPIYFSVDEDVSGAQVADYFRGVASVIGLHRTGAYGSFRVLQYLFANNLISWGWQTYAWSGGQWLPPAQAQIQQYNNGQTLDGHSVDFDRSMTADFGQWFVGGTMLPNGWQDDGTTLTAPNGHRVVFGFRNEILEWPGGWDPTNQPLSEEFHANPLEYSNPSLGQGQKQCFNQTTLEFTDHVFVAWQGQEIYALLQALQVAQSTLVAVQAELAACQASGGFPAGLQKAVNDAENVMNVVLASAATLATAIDELKPFVK